MTRQAVGVAVALALCAGLAGCAGEGGFAKTRDFGFEGSNFEAETRQKPTLSKGRREAELARLRALGQSHVARTEQDIARASR